MRTYSTKITTSGGTGAAIEETHLRPDGGEVTVLGPIITVDDGAYTAEQMIRVMTYAAQLVFPSEDSEAA